MLADEDNVDIVGHDNNTSFTFQLPDNRHYNSVILHINISIEIYTISFGAISKLKGTCGPKTFTFSLQSFIRPCINMAQDYY